VERVGSVADRRVAIVETQLPHERLALVVRDVIQLRQPRWVLSAGFAFSLRSEVAGGHLLVADRLVDSQGYALGIATKIASSRGLHVGTLLSVAEYPKDDANADSPAVADESALAWETQAVVIAEVCRVLKTTMMAIHGIAGNSTTGESTVTKEMKTQESIAGMLGAAAGALLEKPSSFKDLWNDSEKTLVVSDRLAKFLVGVMSQLPPR
jgi:nucleoside phosphorylase